MGLMTAPAADGELVVDVDADDWVERLSGSGARRDEAVARLHALLIRATRHQVRRMQVRLGPLDVARVEEIVQQAADEATVSVLRKLPSFEGRSRFTTWAYKFGILQASVEVNRHLWRHREVSIDDVAEPWALEAAPDELSQATELAGAVRRAIADSLTHHQRRVVLALCIDEIPVDVLAERLGTTRNALYKTLHDARVRLRAQLTAAGYAVPAPRGQSR